MTDEAAPLSHDLGQLFMVGFHGLTPPAGAIHLIQRERVGGIILFERNCQSAQQVSRLIHDLQSAARAAGHPAPLLIATDQEYGKISTLGPALTTFPGQMALGATGSASLTSSVAEAAGRELLALGVTMNLAPSADVYTNPANRVIAGRAFDDHPARVAALTAAAVSGYRAAGIAATLKHFPGHGDTATDSHLALPTLPHDRERLEGVELVPFRAGVAAGADALMLAHLALPAVAPDEGLPASLSPTIVRLAREELGFAGVIITDCLEMGAIADGVGAARGAVLALRAGADIVLVSHTLRLQRAAIASVRAAIASGELPAETVSRALERIRHLKERLPGWERLPAPVSRASVSLPAHRRLAATAYRRAITLARDAVGLLPVRLPDTARILVIAQPPASAQASEQGYQHAALVASVQRYHANSEGAVVGRGAGRVGRAEALTMARTADLLLVATFDARRDPRQVALLRALAATGKPIIALALSAPYDVAAFPQLPTWLAAYEHTPAALDAAADALFGRFTPHGRLPVTLLTDGA
ncbi:MAG: glycoside hydrolase family 3 C-terminal domain-containing protein [Chloroflexota bacterium]|nr:glycoside hydrolase family 3 C-terminal domain-containing protein [Chloroflexota bacterium]